MCQTQTNTCQSNPCHIGDCHETLLGLGGYVCVYSACLPDACGMHGVCQSMPAYYRSDHICVFVRLSAARHRPGPTLSPLMVAQASGKARYSGIIAVNDLIEALDGVPPDKLHYPRWRSSALRDAHSVIGSHESETDRI